MRVSHLIAFLGMVASVVAIEDYPAPDYTVTVIDYEDCSTSSSTITHYRTHSVTICPSCTRKPTAHPTPSSSHRPHPYPSSPKPTRHTTVYTTVYTGLCSTGPTPKTYTVTETCTGEKPSFPTRHPTYMPPGFTQTVTVCTVCGPHPHKPTTMTLTVPCSTTKVHPKPPPTHHPQPPHHPKPPPHHPNHPKPPRPYHPPHYTLHTTSTRHNPRPYYPTTKVHPPIHHPPKQYPPPRNAAVDPRAEAWRVGSALGVVALGALVLM